MKKYIFLFVLLLLVIGCSGKTEKEDKGTNDTAGTQTAEKAVKVLTEEEKRDSLERIALKGDSLKEKHIVVDKETLMLYVREDGKTLMSAPVCVGRALGQKKRLGDHKTPEGEYKIHSIENASSWDYDFHDGKGRVKGAYGPWFFRLNTPQSTHIGIHGTLFPESMGTRESDGCVRMRNEDLENLKQYVFKGMKVIINPDKIPTT